MIHVDLIDNESNDIYSYSATAMCFASSMQKESC